MDEFGVLVESIGFKAYGKSSAPLADLKATNKTNPNANGGFPPDIRSTSTYTSSSINSHDLDGLFGSSSTKPPNSGFNDDDVFGVFRASSSSTSNIKNNNNYVDDDDDVFGLMKSSSSSGGSTSAVDHYDVLGNKVSPVTSPIDDLVGSFGGMGVKGNSVKKKVTASVPADLFSDFGVKSSSLNNGRKSEANNTKSFSASAEDPFLMFEKMQGNSYKVTNGASVVDDFHRSKSEANIAGQSAKSFSEDPFLMFERTQGSSYNGASAGDDYLDSFFSSGIRSNTRSSQSSTTEDSVYDALFNNSVAKQQNKASPLSSKNKKQASSKTNSPDDFSYLFGMGVAPASSGEFQEIEGESEERRKARFNHHMTTQERMNNALNEKNKRDLQAQQERDEKHRVAATLEGDIKRWAVGKEGNLRALLSSLQHVLWAGSGWQPISLTDLITSTAVKKAYYKATLCVHPDKVQQKGASVQQKYIAEKVFDLLKESWNKFNAEEFKKQ